MSKEFNFLVKIYSHFHFKYLIVTRTIEKSHISLNNDKITVEKHIEESKSLLFDNKIISQDIDDQKKEVFLDDLLFVKVKKSRWLKTLLSVSIFVFVLLLIEGGLTWIKKSDIVNDTKSSQNKTKEYLIYNFVNSDLDQQKFDANKQLKKLGKYESKYGTCNIIQGINILYNGENDYYNVIENKEENYSAIILTFRKGFGISYNNYIDYFKKIIPEKQNI